jgi:hypothetical protein
VRSPTHVIKRFADDGVGQRRQRLLRLCDEDRPFAHEFDVGRRRLNLDAPIAFGDLHLLIAAQPKAVADPLGNHEPPRRIDGCPHGTKSTIFGVAMSGDGGNTADPYVPLAPLGPWGLPVPPEPPWRGVAVPGHADFFRAKLRGWADEHRRAARIAGRRPGAKDPLLCVAVDFIRAAWDPVVPVVVDRPVEQVVASLNRLGWLRDEQERTESTAHLIAARDRALAGTATVRVDFEELRATPAVVIRRLADELCLEVTEAQVQAAAESIAQPGDMRRGTHNADRYGLELLRAKVERNPDDWWAVSTLASAYFSMGDFVTRVNGMRGRSRWAVRT